MGRGRTSNKTLPDCEFPTSAFRHICSAYNITSLVVESSTDGKKVRCNLCQAMRQGNGGVNNGWINKRSLPDHLTTDAHAYAITNKQNTESIQAAGERSMQDESAMDENMDFVVLSSTIKPTVAAPTSVSKPSTEEQEMWAKFDFANDAFSAGVNLTVDAAEERRHLELEATNYQLYRGYDYVSKEDPDDGGLLLDEVEQEDILNELLENAGMFKLLYHVYSFQFILCLLIDLNAPDLADLLNEEMSDQKISDAWAPYESKMVSYFFSISKEELNVLFSPK